MECETSDNKKLYKVFDASKHRKSKKKREELDDTNSLGSTETKSQTHRANTHSIKSAKTSLQDIIKGENHSPGDCTPKRESSNLSLVTGRTVLQRCSSRSPRRPKHRSHREALSLALNAGITNFSPRSISPQQDGDRMTESGQKEQDSFIYAFLEEAIKKDKKKQRRHRERHHLEHGRDHEGDNEHSRDKTVSRHKDHDKDRDREDKEIEKSRERDRNNYYHRHRRDEPSRDQNERSVEGKPQQQGVDQTALFQTFAQLCTTIMEKNSNQSRPAAIELTRNQSHKSLQCEAVSREDSDMDQRPVRLRSREQSHEAIYRSSTRVRSLEDIHGSRGRLRSPSRLPPDGRTDKYLNEKPAPKYSNKIEVTPSRVKAVEDDRYRDYTLPTRSSMDHAYKREPDRRDYREYDDERRDRGTYECGRRRIIDEERRRCYEEEPRRCCEKTSRSFDHHREPYPEEERLRCTSRSDSRRRRYDEVRRVDNPERRYDDRRDKYYEEREREYHRERYSSNNLPSKERRWRRNVDRCDRGSEASREDDYGKERDALYKERDGYFEREPESGLDEASTVSGKSNYIRVVKQGIAEQREAMDKMMNLWKELMRCFKGISQSSNQEKVMQDSASVQESAAAQLRLWRECMRRYETVARDVGDTDARLMEELSKQRSEMAEMANMWQECLQRYRDMTNDFNNLKQKLATDVPSRLQTSPHASAPPLLCAEGEGVPPAPYHRPPSTFPPPPTAMGPMGGYVGTGYGGSPLRARASIPAAPAWWWLGDHMQPTARRRSSPDSRHSAGSAERERKHRHKDRARDDGRYKEKSAIKSTAPRYEHRHRKR